ncbi:MAG: membrane-anchored protein YejM (alkaline phosphatase superfamily) [Paraglaciecola sp.]|jgi:membrane-anchored protein YejM (alkaline phosphatase superfamily)
MQMTNEELTQLMIDSAQNAIETTQQEFAVTLDGTEQSLDQVDGVILRWLEKFKDKALQDSAVFTICNIYGAYVGEIFRNKVGGNWNYDETQSDAPYVVLEYAGNTYAFAGICYQRLVNDNHISIKNYFEKAEANHLQ